MYGIGSMPMPAGFRYRDVFLKGKPQHGRYDAFRIRHPQMDVRKRAKLFAPFDALRGFNFAILCKNELYEDRRILSPEERRELNRRLRILRSLTRSGRMAGENRVQVTVTYFEVCSDVNSEVYGLLGQYKMITGICRNVDAEVTKTILVDEMRIRMEDIREVKWAGDTEPTVNNIKNCCRKEVSNEDSPYHGYTASGCKSPGCRVSDSICNGTADGRVYEAARGTGRGNAGRPRHQRTGI